MSIHYIDYIYKMTLILSDHIFVVTSSRKPLTGPEKYRPAPTNLLQLVQREAHQRCGPLQVWFSGVRRLEAGTEFQFRRRFQGVEEATHDVDDEGPIIKR